MNMVPYWRLCLLKLLNFHEFKANSPRYFKPEFRILVNTTMSLPEWKPPREVIGTMYLVLNIMFTTWIHQISKMKLKGQRVSKFSDFCLLFIWS